jgi:hypothetical protein
MAKPGDLSRELESLKERPRAFAETEDLPRGKLPGLFRAARAADAGAELLATLGDELGTRLPDRALLEPIVELARDVPAVSARLLAALEARGRDKDAWAIERQARVLSRGPGSPLERIAGLVQDDPRGEGAELTELAELVEERLKTMAQRRDRTSLEVARGALLLIARKAPRDPRAVALATRVVEAETRRAGKEEPEVALAALSVLAGAEPLARLRAAKWIEQRVDRRKIQDRAAALADAAALELGASKEEVQELLADPGGLGPSGERRIELAGDEPGPGEAHALVTIDPRGRAVSTVVPAGRALDPDERREIDAALAALTKARRDQAQRLERALGAGRSWKLGIFRAIFLARNALLRDLASRLVFLALPEKGGAISFRVTTPELATLEDLFGGPLPALDAATPVRLAHPVELDKDELELWRERFRELGLVQPFPQLHRLVRPVTAAAFPVFNGRELYEQELLDLGRERGYRGLPLRGDGPFEIARDFPGRGAVLALTVDRIAAPAAPAKPRRDELRVLDDPDARKPRAVREAAPRVRILSVKLEGAQDPAALAESVLDLHRLTDAIETGTDAFFAEWQKKKFKDPATSWREAQLKLLGGSEANFTVRLALVRSFGCAPLIQGRLALLPNEVFIELGTGRAFEGPLRDWVPPWKLEDRTKENAARLELPFEREWDEETARIVETIVALSRQKQESGK